MMTATNDFDSAMRELYGVSTKRQIRLRRAFSARPVVNPIPAAMPQAKDEVAPSALIVAGLLDPWYVRQWLPRPQRVDTSIHQRCISKDEVAPAALIVACLLDP
jgi:hypothetical protein